MKRLDSIEAVVKLTEVCNINCSYCYMFNGGNEEYLARPAYMREATVEAIVEFLARGVEESQAKHLHVIYHGGEPMMMKRERFAQVCSALTSRLESRVHLKLSMQTNAMLVDDGWVETLAKFGVGVGVSIDGPPEYHDIDRVDHQGRGTYDRVVAGLRRLQQTYSEGLLPMVGAIAVIRPAFSGMRVYRHLTNDLGLKNLSFLLPIDSHDTFDRQTETAGYGRYMREVFEEWARTQNDSAVRVRFVDELLAFFLSGGTRSRIDDIHRKKHALFVVGSGGELEPDDSMKVTDFLGMRPSVHQHTMMEFLESQEMLSLSAAAESLPDACSSCCWKNGCGGSGGRLVNRYSASGGFNNRSFLCDGLKDLYSSIYLSLVKSGADEKVLEAAILRDLGFSRALELRQPRTVFQLKPDVRKDAAEA